MRYIFKGFLLFLLSFTTLTAYANAQYGIFPTKHPVHVSLERLVNMAKRYISLEAYRQVRFQVIVNDKNVPDHVLVYLFSKIYHGFKVYRINVDAEFNPTKLIKNYQLNTNDYNEQPGPSADEAQCPDDKIEFIAFAPNDNDLEVDITKDVAKSAQDHALQTVQLLIKEANRKNYLNYMACPKLKGNFYDGDADPYEITTNDGIISNKDINKLLRAKFRFKVTNIWLACQAFNDPIKSAVIDVAQSQKYAAGINNLRVGPSDRAAACTMKAAMNGAPMKAAFDDCYKKYDIEDDHWGFDGKGTDIFGT